jgi:Tfp pilus assembly protein PilO
MDKLKQWVALAVVASVAVLAAGWVLLVSPKRDEASELTDQAASLQSGAEALRTQLAVLRAQAERLPEEEAKIAAVTVKIPAEPALPDLVRGLTAAAEAAGVELVQIAPGAPRPVSAEGAAATATTDGSAATAAPGLSSVSLSIGVVGGYLQTERYLAALEDLPRALRVTGLSTAPGSSPTKSTATAVVQDGSVLATTITAEAFTSGAQPTAAASAVPAVAATAPAATTTTLPAAPAASPAQ